MIPRDRLQLPDEVTETMIVCALRFDGYRWLKGVRGDDEIDFPPWTVPVVDTLVFHDDENANFATFFALQRWLFKWGGETLPYSAPDHTAFRFLFLHLYSQPTPEGFAVEEYQTRWRRLPAEVVNRHAAAVRHALRPAPRVRRVKPTEDVGE